MNKKILSILCVLALMISMLGVTAAAEEGPAAKIGETTYETLQDAVDAVKEGDQNGLIVLQQPVDSVTIDCDVYVDLNGKDIGSLTVNNGTFYGMDSETDDFEIDAVNHTGYGKIGEITGNVQNVKGIPVGNENAAEGCSYLMVAEDGIGTSFHCVNLKLENMTLRPNEVGLYFQSNFGGDALVAERVDTFGVALSLKGEPTAENLATDCKLSEFTDFQAGVNNTNTSTILQGVMKETNPKLVNRANSQRSVYGRAYVEIDGTYIFGNARSRSLEEQVVELNKDKTKVTEDVVTMYRKFVSVMRNWNVSNIESAVVRGEEGSLVTGETLKVLAITSSFGLNTTQLLYDVAVAEGYAPENVIVARLYASGCSLEKHVNHAPDKPVYQYSKVTGETGIMTVLKPEGEATLLDGLLDEEWDIIFMQQGAAQSPQLSTYKDYIDQLRDIINPIVEDHCPNAKFIWNMLWGYQSDSTQNVFVNTFHSNQMYMYESNVNAVLEKVVPRTDYDRIIPSGTVVQNARTSFFGDNLCRDTYHLNNLGGALAAYGLFATITGRELTEINLDIVEASNTNGIGGAKKINTPLTEEQKQVIIESVNNALANPFNVTESEFKDQQG